jgi:hypothetical protein
MAVQLADLTAVLTADRLVENWVELLVVQKVGQ